MVPSDHFPAFLQCKLIGMREYYVFSLHATTQFCILSLKMAMRGHFVAPGKRQPQAEGLHVLASFPLPAGPRRHAHLMQACLMVRIMH